MRTERMPKIIARFLVSAMGLLAPVVLSATHIVGGSLYYKCLGNNEFELTLTVYTDCRLGQADYDKPAWLGVYDADGLPVDTIRMDLNNPIDTIHESDPCFLALPDICVRVTRYRKVVTLPLKVGGYTIAYQRCCRNATIQNIVAPLETGATYFVHISEDNLKSCNSSPVFEHNPPIFVCVNEPLIFDHGATDADGDSLSYELFTPYTGGVYILNPQPVPAFPPPYEEVTWVDPPYNLNNLMGGVPLTIDPVTGMMYGVPNTIGQFVVGVKVKEYRNGEYIGERYRDFQYNVVPCVITKAEIGLADTVQCEDFHVSVTNLSENADAYFWDFGDPTTTSDTSSAFEPQWTYPDTTGFYTIRLVVSKGHLCSDTTTRVIFLQKNSLDAAIDLQVPLCEDSLVVMFNDASTDPVSPVVSWDWTVTTENPPVLKFTNSNNQWTFNSTTQAIVNLKVESANGCFAEVQDTFQLNILDVPDLVTDTVNICYLESTYLNPNFDPQLIYTWSPPDGIQGSVNDPNPEILVTTSTDYTVMVTDTTGLCIVERSANIMVIGQLPEIVIDVSIPTCTDSIVVSSTLDIIPEDVTVCWSVETPDSTYLTIGDSIQVVLHASQLLYVCATLKTDSCAATICDTIQANLIPNPGLPDTIRICQGDSVHLFPGGDPLLVYAWTPTDYLDDPTSWNPLAFPPVSTVYTLALTDTVSLCTVTDEVFVEVNDSTKNLDFTWDVYCDGSMVDFFNGSQNISVLHWDFGDPGTDTDISDEEDPMYTYPGPGTYPVLLWTDEAGVCPAYDSLIRELVLEEPVNKADFTFDVTRCGNPATIKFFGTQQSTYGVVTGWSWTFGTIGTSTEQNPVIMVKKSQVLPVTLVVTWDDKCTDTIRQDVDILIYELDLPGSVTICKDSCIQLQTGGDPDWIYEWHPSTWITSGEDGPNPVICPDGPGLLTARIQASQVNGDTCVIRDTLQVSIDDCAFPCPISPDVVTCLDTVCMTAVDCDPELVLVWCSPNGDTLAIGNSACFPTTEWPFVVIKKNGPFGWFEMDTMYIDHLEYTIPVEATSDPYEILMGGSGQLHASTPAMVTYLWVPPQSLNDPSSPDPIATPDSTTIYSLLVTDSYGCVGGDTTILYVRTKICDEPYIFVPNAFTPDGDGTNDVLYVRGFYIDEMEFYIYNRWGEMVFESHDKSIGWDGTYKGQKLRTDVYGYYLKARCFGGEEFFKRGNISLLRQ